MQELKDALGCGMYFFRYTFHSQYSAWESVPSLTPIDMLYQYRVRHTIPQVRTL